MLIVVGVEAFASFCLTHELRGKRTAQRAVGCRQRRPISALMGCHVQFGACRMSAGRASARESMPMAPFTIDIPRTYRSSTGEHWRWRGFPGVRGIDRKLEIERCMTTTNTAFLAVPRTRGDRWSHGRSSRRRRYSFSWRRCSNKRIATGGAQVVRLGRSRVQVRGKSRASVVGTFAGW